VDIIDFTVSVCYPVEVTQTDNFVLIFISN